MTRDGWMAAGHRYPLPGLPPVAFLAVCMVGGVWAAHGMQGWLNSPWPYYLLAVAGITGLTVSGRWVRPQAPWHPGEPAHWFPAGGAVAVCCGAVAFAALGAAQYAAYVRQVETALPAWVFEEETAVELRGVVTEVIPSLAGGDSSAEAALSGSSGETLPRFRLAVQAVRPVQRDPLGPANRWQLLASLARVEVRVAPLRVPPGMEQAYPYRRPPLSAGHEVLVRGVVRRPRPARFPGAFPERDVYTRQGISAIVHVPHVRHLQVSAAASQDGQGRQGTQPRLWWQAAGLNRVALSWRRQVEDALQRQVEDEAASALLRSLLFGDRSLLDPGFEQAVQRSGLAHLLAVSGLHVGFVAGVVAGAAGWLRLPPPIAWPAGALGVLLYILASGAQPPAIRAGVAISLALVAQAVGRRRDGSTAMGLAAVLLVAFRPVDVLSLSFRLSFLAALAIGMAMRALRGESETENDEPRSCWRRMLRWATRWLVTALVVSAAAQAVTAPLLWGSFGEVSLLGLVANIPAVPLAAVTVPLALVGATLEAVWPLAGSLLMRLAGWGARGLMAVVESVAKVPVDPLPSPLHDAFSVVAWYGFLALIAILTLPSPSNSLLKRVDGRLRRIPLLTCWAVAMTILAVGGLILPAVVEPPLEIYFLDVGQGMAVLVRTPAGHHLLIDGGRGANGHPGQDGYDAGRRVILPALAHLGVRRLEAVIYTHADDDHLGGLKDVVEALPVAAAFGPAYSGGKQHHLPSPSAPAPAWDRFQEALADKGVPYLRLERGHRLYLAPEVALEVLHPGPEPVKGAGSEANDNSLVLLLRYREDAWLFTGDLERAGQQAILAAGLASRLRAGGFQVPHHGAAGSYWTPFWEAVNPRVAVISVGRNAFGQPAPRVLQALERKGVAVYRTDRDGTVRAWSRGRGWRVAVSR